jgi:hypothetical protein
VSLEEAVNRLATAMLQNQQGSAVVEILRQRDEAVQKISQRDREVAWHKKQSDYYRESFIHANRRIGALKGVIVKLKKRMDYQKREEKHGH